MTRTTCIWLIALLAFASVARAELPSRPQFTQEKSDLTADPHVRFGQLPDGLRYAILANHEPKQRASLRLLVLAGSAQETDAQQGLAHFVEHLAFKGTTHYPPGTLIEYFQRLGMNFGGDTNARTEFARTVYLLELPNTDAHTLHEAVQVFSDYARGELIEPKEIDSERGVILSEKRDRDSVEYRREIALEKFLYGTTRIPQRLPIGLTEVIEHAPAEQFRAYYDQWYRPERMAIIAVGDFDPQSVEHEIRATAAKLATPVPAEPDPKLGTIPHFDGERVLYFPQPEAAETLLVDLRVRPYAKEPDTRETRIRHLPRRLALAMLNRRMDILTRQADSPILGGGYDYSHELNFYQTSGFYFVSKPDQWSAALRVGEKELHRALTYGFTAAELQEAVANERRRLEEAVKRESTRHSQALADHLVESLTYDFVFTTPEEELALYRDTLARVTPEDCTAALREVFPEAGRYLAVLGNAKIEPKSSDDSRKPETPENQIRAVFRAAEAAPVDPPAQNAAAKFAYSDFGAAGKVAERKHVDDLDIDLLRFANGVRLNLKKTDFEAHRLHIAIRIGTGQLSQPRDQPGLDLFTNETFLNGGLGQHSLDDLIRLMAGRTVGLNFQVASDALQLSGSTNASDLLLELQILAAYTTDPGYRPEAMAVARKNFETLYQKLEHTPEGIMALKVDRDLASGDPRFGVPPKAQLLARTLSEERAWLQPQLARGAIEISIVGDFDPSATIDAVAHTFGALPPREPKPELAAARHVAFPAQPFTRDYTVQTEIPRALVALIWPTTDSRDVQRQRRLNLLSDVFADRLRVELRDKLGSAYSPSAYDSAEETYPGYGRFVAAIEADPAKTREIVDAVKRIASDLATHGATADELTRAKEPVLTALRESARTNGYWLNSVLQSAQEFPQHLAWSRTRYADNESITQADLDTLAKEYLPSVRAFQIVIVPEPPARSGTTRDPDR